MQNIDSIVHNEIRKHGLLVPHDKVLVGASGGPDSMALLHWLVTHALHWPIEVAAIHLNHSFRGWEADEDQRFVERVCQELGIRCFSKKMDVAAYAERQRLSKQMAARQCRYTYYAEIAAQESYTKVALGHHADDQVETILMRLVRGSGLNGLQGIPIKRSAATYTFIRPFIALQKEEIEAYCRTEHIDYRLDPSNWDTDYVRNYLRHDLVPGLLELNPNLHETVYDMSQIIADENEYMDQLAKQYVEQMIVRQSPSEVKVRCSLLQTAALPLQRRIILLLLNYLPSGQWNVEKIHIDSLLAMIQGERGYKLMDLPGSVQAVYEYGYLYLIHSSALPAQEALSSPSTVWIDQDGTYSFMFYTISVEHTEARGHFSVQDTDHHNGGEYSAFFDADQLSMPLQVRTRLDGDRIQLLGMNGHKKVKDIFIDAKIPRHLRSTWPVVAADENILWIPGLKRSTHALVTPETKRVLQMSVQQDEIDMQGANYERGHR